MKYSRNNTKVSTLMHVDKTLPLWVFFDVYGNVQKIRSLGWYTSSVSVKICKYQESLGGKCFLCIGNVESKSFYFPYVLTHEKKIKSLGSFIVITCCLLVVKLYFDEHIMNRDKLWVLTTIVLLCFC